MEPAKQVENLHQGYQNTSFGHRDQDLCKGIALWAITNKEETQREETLDSSLFIINSFQVYLGILFLFLEGWRFGLGFGLEPHGFPPSFSKKNPTPYSGTISPLISGGQMGGIDWGYTLHKRTSPLQVRLGTYPTPRWAK